MRAYKDINLNQMDIKPHNILFCHTSEPDYEMERIMLLEELEGLECGEFLLLEGYHNSCCEFDEAGWEATVYTMEELRKLAQEKITDVYYENKPFWQMILSY